MKCGVNLCCMLCLAPGMISDFSISNACRQNVCINEGRYWWNGMKITLQLFCCARFCYLVSWFICLLSFFLFLMWTTCFVFSALILTPTLFASPVRSEFIFVNPNSKGQCGCGESFKTTGSSGSSKPWNS